MSFIFPKSDWKDKDIYFVLDQDGNRVFSIQKMSFQRKTCMYLLNEENKEMGMIGKDNYKTAYLERKGKRLAQIVRSGLFRRNYSVLGLDWKIEKSVESETLKITSAHGEIASLQICDTSFQENYYLQIESRYDAITVLCFVIAYTLLS